MAKMRVHKHNNYTVVDNELLRNKDISLKAKGLLSVMLSLPDNWTYTIAGLVAICKENETAVKNTLDELKRFGYLRVTKLMPDKTESGVIEYIYDVYSSLDQNPCYQGLEKQGIENQALENLPLDNLALENQGQLNKEELKKEVKKKEELKKENLNNKDAAARQSNDIEKEFENLWTLYPNKKGKANALKEYIKVRKGHPEIYEKVEKGIQDYIAYLKAKKTDPKFVKHGSTWFHQKCWEDDYSIGGNSDGSHPEANGAGSSKWGEVGITL